MKTRRWIIALVAALAAASGLANVASSEQATNAHFSQTGQVALPGRGMSIAWSPTGASLAMGGHFREKATGHRYDTRTVDVAGQKLVKSFNCHYWWTIAHAWQKNPYIGEVVADGGGDHSVKIWNANGPGSAGKCKPGMFSVEDGGVKALYNINGWITSLQFSPDGKYLAGASRDRTVRIWQIEPGVDQYKVVALWYEKVAKQILSVKWAPDGKRLVIGDRSGRVSEWAFDPATDRWDTATIAEFAKMGWSGHQPWFNKNALRLAPKVLWTEGGHKMVWNARYSPDGTKVAAAGTDGILSVYQAKTGAVLYRVNAVKPKSEFHGLDWSPDGLYIAAGSSDKNIYVYNAANGSLYDTLVGSGTLVTSVAFSPDGKKLATAAGGQRIPEGLNQVVQGPDDTVRIWTRH